MCELQTEGTEMAQWPKIVWSVQVAGALAGLETEQGKWSQNPMINIFIVSSFEMRELRTQQVNGGASR